MLLLENLVKCILHNLATLNQVERIGESFKPNYLLIFKKIRKKIYIYQWGKIRGKKMQPEYVKFRLRKL